jgi:hypothetical protein
LLDLLALEKPKTVENLSLMAIRLGATAQQLYLNLVGHQLFP